MNTPETAARPCRILCVDDNRDAADVKPADPAALVEIAAGVAGDRPASAASKEMT